MGSFSKIKNLLEEKNSFLLIGHIDPDGDCLGSILALGEFLENRGKSVLLACKDRVPKVFQFLPNSNKIKSDFLVGDFDAVILLDNGDFRRTGFSDRLRPLIKKTRIINIDHHTKNDLWKIADINYVDEEASSTSEILYDLFVGIGAEITPDMATNLLAGIFNDTGGFKHPNTSTRVLQITSSLLKRGARLKKISQNLFCNHSIEMLKLWGIALDRLIVNEKYHIVSSIILQKDLIETGATENDISGLVNLINTIPNCKIALLLYETFDGRIKGSLRTESDNINIADLAKIFGGGGHKKRPAGHDLFGRSD